MNIKLLGLVISFLFVGWDLPHQIASAGQVPPYNLTLRLPREVTVSSETLTLGQIAMITGDEGIAAEAGEVELGRISMPGQKITIDRAMIRSRLACSGITECDPVLLGADKVTVKQMVKVIKSDSFVGSASSFLAENIKEQTIARWEPLREPAELVLSNQSRDIELLPRLVSRSANGQVTTEVSVVAGGEVLGTRRIVFRPKYNTHRAVAAADVSAGTPLTPDNTRIENVITDESQAPDWAPPYGLVTVRDLAAGTIIVPGIVKTPRPRVIIERNQTVVIRIDKPGLVVTAMGKTMQRGRLDDYIKVRNIDSQRVIMARVNEDGTVEPAF